MLHIVQGGSNITGTDCGLFTHKPVPVIFEPTCTYHVENTTLHNFNLLKTKNIYKESVRTAL